MFEELRDFIATQAEIDKETIKLETELTALGVDSLKLLTIISDLEEKFNVSISDKELQALNTIKDLLEVIEKNK